MTDKCVSFLLFPPVPISLPAQRNLQEMCKETQVLLSRRLQQNPIKTKGKKSWLSSGKSRWLPFCFLVEGSRGKVTNLCHGDELRGGAEKPALWKEEPWEVFWTLVARRAQLVQRP